MPLVKLTASLVLKRLTQTLLNNLIVTYRLKTPQYALFNFAYKPLQHSQIIFHSQVFDLNAFLSCSTYNFHKCIDEIEGEGWSVKP